MTTRLVCNVPPSLITAKANGKDRWNILNLRDKIENTLNARLFPLRFVAEVISYEEKTGARMSLESETPFDTAQVERALYKASRNGFQNPSQSSLFQ